MAYIGPFPVPVQDGGTGAATLTDHGVLVGSGTAAITPLSVGTNGQVLLGATGADPSFATLTSTDGTITFIPGINTLDLSVGVRMLVTPFLTSGTWTKNANTINVTVIGWNGGGGGGSGRQGSTAASGGGGGGGCGGSFYLSRPASFFGNSETVTIGAGGAGGLTQGSAASNGNSGGASNVSSLGNLFVPPPSGTAGSGGGGTTSAGTAGGGIGCITDLTAYIANTLQSGAGSNLSGAAGNSSNTTSTTNQPLNISPTGSGGGGGGDTATNRSGGIGGAILSLGLVGQLTLLAGGTGGLESGTINGGDGNPGFTTGGIITGGTGGGGGGGQKSGLVAGTGGKGGLPGGPGGGGGGSITGTTSGIGGAGGNGKIIVIEYF